jgi:hypothetical protein
MSDGSGWKAGELADTLRAGEFEADVDAVLSDDEIAGDCIMRLDDDSPLRDLLSEQTSTDMLRSARQTSDVASMSAATGLSDSTVEATGYERLISRCTPAAQQILIKGEKGSGKTVLALDLAKRLYTHFEGDLSIATNIRGPDDHDDVTLVETMSEMLLWMKQTDGEKLVIGDEWSTTMNAHANPGGSVRFAVSRFINALRKGKGGSTRLAIIGHEHDTDIASILRNQSDVVIHKAGKADQGLADQAAIFDGWTDYQSGDQAFKLRGLQDVPESSVWGADTNYFATFEMDLDDPQKQVKKGRLIENWEQYQESDDSDDSSGRERVICRGETTTGDDCKQTTDHVSGYCQPHRDQWDGESSHPKYDDQQEVTNP